MTINSNLIGWEKYVKSIRFFMLVLYVLANRLEDENSIYYSMVELNYMGKDNQEPIKIIKWNDLRMLVAQNQIEEIFKIVETFIFESYHKSLINKFLLLQADYSRLKEQEFKNILSPEKLEIKRNRINENILLLIDELSK